MPSIDWKYPQRPWVTQSSRDNSSKGRSPHVYDKRYKSKNWRVLREQILMESPLCLNCKDMGRVTPARVVDHIIPVRDGGSFYDPNNLQPLCDRCHNSKSGKESHNRGGMGVEHAKSKITRNVVESSVFSVNNSGGES